MKCILLIYVFSSLVVFPVFAQRHIKGFKAIEVSAAKAISSKAIGAPASYRLAGDVYGIGYSAFLSNRFYLKGEAKLLDGGSYAYVQRYDSTLSFDKRLSYKSYRGDISANFTLFQIGQVFFFNVSAGVSGYYDQVRHFSFVPIQDSLSIIDPAAGKTVLSAGEKTTLVKKEPATPQSQLRAGCFAGIETELYLTSYITFLVSARQRFLLNSAYLPQRLHMGIGLRFNF